VVEESSFKQCSYFVVRYVPDVVKEEFLNIGLFLFCPSAQFLECRFSENLGAITRFHPHADTEFLKQLQLHFQQQIEEHKSDLSGYLLEMQQSYSNLIQLSPPRTCLATDLRAELQDLFSRYVGARLTVPTKEQVARRRIKRQMAESLRRYGVLNHESFKKNIGASRWTGAGDPFVFDFGYRPPEQVRRPNGRLKLIHTLSLQKDNELAKALRLTFTRILEKESSSYLTVGHEDIREDLPRLDLDVVYFSQSLLQHERIVLRPAATFDEYARSIRTELLM
jgi:hypothetical protein